MTSLEHRLRRLALTVSLRAIRPEAGEDWQQWLDAVAAQLDRGAHEARALERTGAAPGDADGQVTQIRPHWLRHRRPLFDEADGVVVSLDEARMTRRGG